MWKPALVLKEPVQRDEPLGLMGGRVMPLGNKVDVIQHLGKKNLFILLA